MIARHGLLEKATHMLSSLAKALRLLFSGELPEVRTMPPITLTAMEHRQLNVLAMVGAGHNAAASDRLYRELDRARVVPEKKFRGDIVRMGSVVTFRTDSGATRTVQVVYPEQAYGPSRVSILSPLGTALIGIAARDSIPFEAAEDRPPGTLTVLSVSST
jgi:regulator of nucleoside diphosphate kinase